MNNSGSNQKTPRLVIVDSAPVDSCTIFVTIKPKGGEAFDRWEVSYSFKPESEFPIIDEGSEGVQGDSSTSENVANEDGAAAKSPDPASSDVIIDKVASAKSPDELERGFGQYPAVSAVISLIAEVNAVEGDMPPDLLARIKRTRLLKVSRSGKKVSVSVDQFDGSMLSADQVDVENVHDCCVASLWAMAARELGIRGKQATALRNYARKGLTKFNHDEFFGIGE